MRPVFAANLSVGSRHRCKRQIVCVHIRQPSPAEHSKHNFTSTWLVFGQTRTRRTRVQFRFIHAADIHLDSPMVGLEQYECAPVEDIRCATRKALQNLVRLAIDESVSFVLIAGDIYDGDWRNYGTGLFFASQMSELDRHGIKVFIVSGNHDAESTISRHLRLPDNTHVFDAKRPETVDIKDLRVTIYGQSFAHRDVTEDLSASYPHSKEGYFNIGLLHTCADGREGYEKYAPCDVNGLTAKGYDYWALGHIHKSEIIKTSPYIVFPGNIQGRHVNETEYDRQGKRTGGKGCKLVTVEDGHVDNVEHRVLDVLRWCNCEVKADGAGSGDDVVALCRQHLCTELEHTEDQMLAARLTITGNCKAHDSLWKDPERWLNEIRSSLTGMSGGRIWLEKLNLKTSPTMDLESIRSQPGPLSDLIKFIDEIPTHEESIKALIDSLEPLRTKIGGLPSPDSDSQESIKLNDQSCILSVLQDVQYMLAQRLLQDGGLG